MKWKDWDNEVANEWDEETLLEKVARADEVSNSSLCENAVYQCCSLLFLPIIETGQNDFSENKQSCRDGKMQCGHTAAVFICNCYEGNKKTFRNKDVWSSSCGWLYVHKHMPCSGIENMALRVMTDSLRVPISLIQTTTVLTSCCGSHILHFINNREETKNNRTLKTRACGWKIFSYKTLTKHWSALTKVIYIQL